MGFLCKVSILQLEKIYGKSKEAKEFIESLCQGSLSELSTKNNTQMLKTKKLTLASRRKQIRTERSTPSAGQASCCCAPDVIPLIVASVSAGAERKEGTPLQSAEGSG